MTEKVALACPRCRRPLAALHCAPCGSDYACRDGLPDLRVPDLVERRYAQQLAVWQTINRRLRAWRARRRARESDRDEEQLSRLLAWVGEVTGPLLDIGCKDGALARMLPGIAYHGIDPYPQLPAATGVVWGNAEFLPYPDGSFAQVCAVSTLDYFLSPDDACREIARALQPGGIFWGAVGAWGADYNCMYGQRLKFIGRGVLRNDPDGYPLPLRKRLYRYCCMPRMYMTYFTPGKLRALLQRHFTVERMELVDYGGSPVAWFRCRAAQEEIR